LAIATLGACATERFGRQIELTEAEKSSYGCKEIDIEIAKAQGFVEQVSKQRGEFKGTDVLAFLGDFGIGNNMEANEAVKSAQVRLDQLRALRQQKNCA